MKTDSAFEPVWTSLKSSTIYLSSRGAHLIGLDTFLIVDEDPSNSLIFLYYFCMVSSASGALSWLCDTNLSVGDLAFVMSTVTW